MSLIVNEVKSILKSIDKNGTEINNTMEINNVVSVFYPHKMKLFTEEVLIASFYEDKIGDWNKRQELEKDHYKFLESFIIHKVKEIQYFHNLKSDDFSSRKNIIWSQDCIGAIQFLHRENENILNIFIRSSDAVNLLLSDYLFGCKLLDVVLDRFEIKKNKCDKVTFFTTSVHYYVKDINKVIDIIR